jgi:hypothetical protein
LIGRHAVTGLISQYFAKAGMGLGKYRDVNLRELMNSILSKRHQWSAMPKDRIVYFIVGWCPQLNY